MGVVSCQKEKRLLVQEFVGAATDTGSAVFGVRHAPPVMTSSARVSSIVFMSPQGTASAGKNAPELSRRLYCVWTRGYQLPSNTQQYIVELLRVMCVTEHFIVFRVERCTVNTSSRCGVATKMRSRKSLSNAACSAVAKAVGGAAEKACISPRLI